MCGHVNVIKETFHTIRFQTSTQYEQVYFIACTIINEPTFTSNLFLIYLDHMKYFQIKY